MNAKQQLAALGISAEAYDGHVLIQSDRTFMMMTTEEIEKFQRWMYAAYREAKEQRQGEQAA